VRSDLADVVPGRLAGWLDGDVTLPSTIAAAYPVDSRAQPAAAAAAA